MPNFPFSWYNLTDQAIGELSTSISATASSLTLRAGQGVKFPASDFIVRCHSEEIHAASRNIDVLNSITRGYGNTTATTHAASSQIYISASRSLFQRIYDNITSHTHNKVDIPDFSHTHAQGDITNLVSDLAAKQAASEKGQANGYASLDAQGKVPSAQLPASGSDPWVYIFTTSNFFVTSNTVQNVPGLSLVVSPNTRYEIEGTLLVRTSSAAVGPRPAIMWPAGVTEGVAKIRVTSGAGTDVTQNGTAGSTVIAPVGGLPTTVSSWPADIWCYMICGASASSTFRIGLASETNVSSVSIRTSSFIKYRIV